MAPGQHGRIVYGKGHVFEAVPPYLDNRADNYFKCDHAENCSYSGNDDEINDLGSNGATACPECGKEISSSMIWFGLKVVPTPDQDLYAKECSKIRNRHPRDKADELVEKLTKDMVKKHVVSINNLVVAGHGLITDFDTFYEVGPPDMVKWLMVVVLSSEELTRAERKNFLQGSGSA